MKTKTATYQTLDGKDLVVEYDPEAPCVICGQPVIEASVGGTAVCSWCDCGEPRPKPWHDGLRISQDQIEKAEDMARQFWATGCKGDFLGMVRQIVIESQLSAIPWHKEGDEYYLEEEND